MSFGIPVRNGLGLGLLASTSLATGNVGGSAPFTPASLFASGAPGFLLDATLSDLSSLFQDSAGTIPAAINEAVGLVLDDSQNAVGTNGAKRVNLLNWTEAFNDAVWTKTAITLTSNDTTAPDGTLTADKVVETNTATSGTIQAASTTIALANQRFVLSVKPSNITWFIFGVFNNANSEYVLVWFNVSTGVVGTSSTFGTAFSLVALSPSITAQANGFYQLGFTVSTTVTQAKPFFCSATTDGGLTRVTTGTYWPWGADLRLASEASTLPTPYQPITSSWAATMAGNHFVQSTPTARPVLSARVNLLEKTEDLANAYWAALGLASRTVSGTFTTLTEDTFNSTHTVVRTTVTSVPNGTQITARAIFKAGTRRYVLFGFDNGATGVSIVIDTVNWTTTNVSTATFISSSVVEVGVGEYRVTVTGSIASGSTNINVPIYGNNSASAVAVTYLGNGSTIIVGSIDLRVANDTASPVYQRVNTATDYATTGFPIYLRYDGADDFLVSAATVNFSTTAQMSVFAGVRKLSDAALQPIVELSANPDANNGSFWVAAGNMGGGANRLTYGAATRGTTNIYQEAYRTYTSPDTRVMSVALQNSGSPLISTRLNGVLVSANTTFGSTSAANYGNYLTYIGMRAGTSLPLNGRIYFPLVVLGRTATATEIANMESFLNTRNGIY